MGQINSVQGVWEGDDVRVGNDLWAIICHTEKEGRHPSKRGILRAHKVLGSGSVGWPMPRKKV